MCFERGDGVWEFASRSVKLFLHSFVRVFDLVLGGMYGLCHALKLAAGSVMRLRLSGLYTC